jgi:hypothetical protein
MAERQHCKVSRHPVPFLKKYLSKCQVKQCVGDLRENSKDFRHRCTPCICRFWIRLTPPDNSQENPVIRGQPGVVFRNEFSGASVPDWQGCKHYKIKGRFSCNAEQREEGSTGEGIPSARSALGRTLGQGRALCTPEKRIDKEGVHNSAFGSRKRVVFYYVINGIIAY